MFIRSSKIVFIILAIFLMSLGLHRTIAIPLRVDLQSSNRGQDLLMPLLVCQLHSSSSEQASENNRTHYVTMRLVNSTIDVQDSSNTLVPDTANANQEQMGHQDESGNSAPHGFIRTLVRSIISPILTASWARN